MRTTLFRSILAAFICGITTASAAQPFLRPVSTALPPEATTPAAVLESLMITTVTLRPFGYDMFQGKVQEPPVEGPVDEDYLVGPNDELLIETWGEYVKRWPVTVSADGYVDLMDEDLRVFVNGLTLRDVRNEVEHQLALRHSTMFRSPKPGVPQSKTEPKAWVKLTPIRVRPILVYVTGEVNRPGTVQMSASVASLINVLINAGGIKPTGSLRHIRISRAGLGRAGVTQEVAKFEDIDFYDVLLRGDTKPLQTRMKYGETVFVDLKRNSVAIHGRVRRPGIYEMRDDECLRDLMGFAGGPLPGAYLKRIQVVRREMDLGTRTLDVDYTTLEDDGTTFPLADGDIVQIFSSVEEDLVVTIEGQGVYRPGHYQFTEGMTLADLIEKAEGLRSQAYLQRADLIRTRPDFTKEYSSFSLTQLYAVRAPQSFKADLIADKSHQDNFKVRRLDRAIIYSIFEMVGRDKVVTLEGHTKQSGVFMLAQNMKLSDLLFAYGGFDDADWRKATYLERADIFRMNPEDLSVRQIEVNLRKVLEGDRQSDLLLQSLDRVVIYEYKAFHPDPYYTITGSVRQPGRYLLGQNTTLADAIVTARGLLDEAYKYEAEVIRTLPSLAKLQQPAEKILVRIPENYASAPREQGFQLKKDDVVFIRKVPGWERPRFVWALGELEFPGQYILAKADERLSDLIERAGGLKKTAYAPGTVFARVPPQTVAASDQISTQGVLRLRGPFDQPTTMTRVAVDLKRALSEPGGVYDVILREGDLLWVPVDPMAVEVRGAVHVPARVQYQKGRGIKDYIKQCGGYTDEAVRRDVLVLLPDGITRRNSWRLFEPEVPSGSVIIVPPYEPRKGEDILALPLTPTGTETTATVALIQMPWPRLPAPTPREIARREARAVGPAMRAAAAVTTPTAITQTFIIPPAGAISPWGTMLPPWSSITGQITTGPLTPAEVAPIGPTPSLRR